MTTISIIKEKIAPVACEHGVKKSLLVWRLCKAEFNKLKRKLLIYRVRVRMMKKAMLVLAAVLLIVFVSACGKDKDAESVTESISEPVAEVENEIVEDSADEVEEIDDVESVEEETTAEWIDAYKNFLSKKENLKPILFSCPNFLEVEGCMLEGFALQDLNDNGVPELIIGASNFDGICTSTFIYEYSDAEVTLKKNFCNTDADNGLGDFYKDDRENSYYMWLDNFGDVGTSTSLYKYGDSEEFIYSNEYDWDSGEIVEEHGNVNVYNDITSHLLKISYCSLSDENIQDKICEDYNADEYFKQAAEDAGRAGYPYTAYRKYMEEVTDEWSQKRYIDWKNYRCFYDFELEYAVNILDIDPDNIEDWRLTYYVEMQKNYIDYINNSISYCFVYIDDDDIPECLVIVGLFGNDAGGVVLTICNNEVKSTKVCPYANHVKYKYKPKNNIFCTEYFGDYTESVDYYALKSGEFKILDELNRSDYEINIGNSGIYRYWKSYYDPENILSEAEYNEIINSYGEFVEISEDDFSSSIMDAKVLQ